MFLLIDNRDSFSYNLHQYFRGLNAEIRIVRNDEVTCEEIAAADYEGLIISPGPGSPQNAGICLEVVREFAGKLPIFGVCLGHQTIAEALGGTVTRGDMPMHGRGSDVTHDGSGLFSGVPSTFHVGRYHSLVVRGESLPSSLRVTATANDDGAVMALEHVEFPIWGVQFHPESILTKDGKTILGNFLRMAAAFRKGETS